jgi:two-component system sensor histidine kinase KdpD
MNTHALTRDYRWGMAAAVAGTAIATGAMAPFRSQIGLLNEGLVLLLVTLLVSSTWGWRVGVFAAIIANLALNFFFVDPLFTFTVHEANNGVALIVSLAVSLIGGTLLSRARQAASIARQRQAETEVLLGLSRELIGRAEAVDALTALCDSAARAFDAPGASVLSPSDGRWTVLAFAGGDEARREPNGSERLMAQQAVDSGQLTWLGHTGLTQRRRRRAVIPGPTRRVEEISEGVAFVPLLVGERTLGVLRLDGPIGDTPFRDHPQQLLDGFAREAALGVQRVELTREAAHAEALRYADEMKTALLTSISHDLKTPLAGIKAAVSSLLDDTVAWSKDDVQTFLETIDSQADRLDRVISDILDLNRIESGVVRPMRRTAIVQELLEDAIERTRTSTAGRAVSIATDARLAVYTDESLVVQALVNLIENAAKYSTPGGAIRLGGAVSASGVELSVADEGPGISERDLPHIFERFYRATDHSTRVKGSGLGLAIVKGFVTLSGGTVRADSSPDGTRFVITLPAAVEAGAA